MCGINILGQTIKTSNCCRTKTIFVANISSSNMIDHCLVQAVVLSAQWKYHIYDLLIPSTASSNLCFENLGACKFHCFTIHPNLVIFSFLLNFFFYTDAYCWKRNLTSHQDLCNGARDFDGALFNEFLIAEKNQCRSFDAYR